MIELREIDQKNFMQCLLLKVAPGQEEFVASNAFSIAQAKYLPEYRPLAIYEGNEMVGFAMYAEYPQDDLHWIMRLMIDARHQRKGYGKFAMTALIAHIMSSGKGHMIRISYHPDNTIAEKLYESLGFYKNGQMIEEEIVMELDY